MTRATKIGWDTSTVDGMVGVPTECILLNIVVYPLRGSGQKKRWHRKLKFPTVKKTPAHLGGKPMAHMAGLFENYALSTQPIGGFPTSINLLVAAFKSQKYVRIKMSIHRWYAARM